MSGPKYSRAQIRELQRLKQLEKQLEEQLEKSKRQQVLSDISKIEKLRDKYCKDSVLKECEDLIPEAEQLIPDSDNLTSMKNLLKMIKSAREEHCCLTGNSEELLARYSTFCDETEKIKNSLLLLKDIKKRIVAEGNVALHEKRINEFLSEDWKDTGEKIDILPRDLHQIYMEVVELLSELPDFEHNKELIDNTIMKTGDVAYRIRQLELRKKAIIVEKNSSHDNIKLLTLTNELRGLYSLLGWEAKSIPIEIPDIEKAIAAAKNEADNRQKSRYIADCIHKVFQEKGYSLVDDAIVSSNSGQIKKDYYEFGDDSLINVSMSDSGQMLFEVVGDGTEAGMTDSRAAKLESEMRRFCPNYVEIRDALKNEYGVLLEDEHLCQPDKKYAKAVDVSEQGAQRRAKKEKKMMHYDD